MVALNAPQVAHLVQQCLRQDDVVGSKVRVLADLVRLGDDDPAWWWVPVAFQADSHRLSDFYELFSSIEEKLDVDNHVNVLLVPQMNE